MDLSTLTKEQLRVEIDRREEEKWKQGRAEEEVRARAAGVLIAEKFDQMAAIIEQIKAIANDAKIEIDLPESVDDGEFGETKTWDGSRRDWYSSNC